MLELLMWICVFLVSLTVLIKASDYFTASAERIGLMIGFSQFLVGAVIVSVGTSLPELISSVVSVVAGSSEIVTGNVVGSNIANVFLILGVAAVAARRIRLKYNLLSIDLPMLTGSALLLVLATWDGRFTRGEAIIFLAALMVFFYYAIMLEASDSPKSEAAKKIRPPVEIRPVITLIASALFVFIGAKYTIDSIIIIAKLLNVGSEIVAVTAVALGTSLPELSVTISAVRRANPELIIGNILGSNIFNTYAVMGISGLIQDLTVTANMIEIGLPFMVAATILFVIVTVDRRITRWEGYMFFVFYAFFICKIIGVM